MNDNDLLQNINQSSEINNHNNMHKNNDVNNCNMNNNNSNLSVEVPSEKKRKCRPTRRSIKSVCIDYCSNSSIHGIKYLAQNSRYEKLFWILVFVISIYMCLCLIRNIWIKWEDTPIIVSFSEKSTPVWEIPFPGITICPETKFEKSEQLNFTKLYGTLRNHLSPNGNVLDIPQHIISVDQFDNFRTLLQVCGSHLVHKMLFPSYRKIDYLEKLNNITPEFNATYNQCKWRNKLMPCHEIFQKTYTEEGICYTMNGLNSSELFRNNTFQHLHYINQRVPNRLNNLEWTLQDGYKFNAAAETYPRRVFGDGARSGILMALQDFQKNLDYICQGPVQGFKVLLHAPDDVPQVSKYYFRVPFNKEVLVWVRPNMITTSNGIGDNYDPSRRQCFFETERYLTYFKVYTQNNCKLECLTNHTLNRCGCVKFSMPRTPMMNVCDETKILCLDDAEDELSRNEFAEGVVDSKINYLGFTKCNCLPSCTSLTYDMEISQANFDLNRLLEAYNSTNYLKNFPGVHMSRLAIFFKESEFITSKRSELYGRTDFLANAGGLAGLFMGTSILSFIEMVYFLIFRLCNIWNWSIT